MKLTDDHIDELVTYNPSYFSGKNIEFVKEEMGKLRDLIQKTKDEATSKGKYFKNNELEPSMLKNWLVENCAEIWAVRMLFSKMQKLKILC